MRIALLIPGLFLVALGCAKDDAAEAGNETGSPDLAGSVCETPTDCYPGIDPVELAGEVECLDRVDEGYCTHQCASDEDCCAIEGECETDLAQVCAPFESTGLMMCFLSCEPEDVSAAGAEDDAAFCQEFVSPAFLCRSSGGGQNNRKICVPGACGLGASCSADADCGPNLECLDEVDGGFCGVRDCASNADCPVDSLCISHAGINHCAPTCAATSDCTFCRYGGPTAACTTDVDYIEGGGAVCVVG